MALGVALLVGAAFVAVLATPLALPALVGAIVVASSSAAQLIAIAAVAVLLIPLGALVAARLKLKRIEEFIFVRSGARVLEPSSKLGGVFAQMAATAGLKETPRYGVMEDVDNAFALGGYERVGLVLLGRQLAGRLRPAEVLAILGHELGHIAMLDSKRAELAIGHQDFLFAFLGLNGLKRFGRGCLTLVNELVMAAHSRHREYWADAVGAYVTSKSAMISALRSLDSEDRNPTALERHFSAIMFAPASRLFATHPTFEQRIKALEQEVFLSRLPVGVLPEPVEAPSAPTAPSYDGI